MNFINSLNVENAQANIRYNLSKEIDRMYFDEDNISAVEKLTMQVVSSLGTKFQYFLTAVKKINISNKADVLKYLNGEKFGAGEALEIENSLVEAGLTREDIYQVTDKY
jgi:hypothetical protein